MAENKFEVKQEGKMFLRKAENPEGNRPDYYGNANVDGNQKEVSIWVNRDEDGNVTGLSGVIKDPYIKPTGGGGMKPKPKPNRSDL